MFDMAKLLAVIFPPFSKPMLSNCAPSISMHSNIYNPIMTAPLPSKGNEQFYILYFYNSK